MCNPYKKVTYHKTTVHYSIEINIYKLKKALISIDVFCYIEDREACLYRQFSRVDLKKGFHMKVVKNISIMCIVFAVVLLLTNANIVYSETAPSAQEEYSTQKISGTDLINKFLTSTPDSVKSSILTQLPNGLKGYLIQFIDFIKTFLNEENKENLQKLKMLLQQSMTESTQAVQSEALTMQDNY